jgi:hypothetical protein
MKSTTKYALLTVVALSALAAATAFAQIRPQTAGLGLRGSYWNIKGHTPMMHVWTGPEYDLVDVGGAGGWLYFFSRTSDSWFLELHLGAFADVIERHEYLEGTDTRVLAVAPVLLGLRHPLLSPHNPAALRPYIAFGGGPYWIADIFVQERYYEHQEVEIASKLHPGGYAGGGLDFMLSSNFGLNFEVKHHFVNFNVHDEHSGYEFAMGVQFCWGDYKPARRD